MPYKLSPPSERRNVDLERFALASTVEERRAFVDERFTAGTASLLLRAVRRQAFRTPSNFPIGSACACGETRRPDMGPASASWTGERGCRPARGRAMPIKDYSGRPRRSDRGLRAGPEFQPRPQRLKLWPNQSAASQFAVLANIRKNLRDC